MSFMYRDHKKGPRTVPWGTPDKTRTQSDFIPFTKTLCCLKQRKESIHFNVLPPVPWPYSLLLRSSWGGVSNAFSKSNMNVATCPLLSKIFAQSFIIVVNWVSQLCPFLNACCLSDRSLYSSGWAWYLNIHCTMCSSNLQGTQVIGNQAIIARKWPVTLLERGQIFVRDRSFGISPVSTDCWKRLENTGPNSVASSFRTLGWSSSPKALEGVKPLRSLITPSLETAKSFMKGADLSRSGTWVCSFLLNTFVNWPLNSSAFSRSDWATPFPLFLFKGGIPTPSWTSQRPEPF